MIGSWLGRSIVTLNVSFDVPEFPSWPDASWIVIAGLGSLSWIEAAASAPPDESVTLKFSSLAS